jgi:hypothetical protein
MFCDSVSVESVVLVMIGDGGCGRYIDSVTSVG